MNKGTSMKIAITRPKEHLEASVELLKSKGFEVVASPMIGVSVRDDPEFEPFLSRVIDRRCDFVIFTSVNGVKFMLEKVDEARKQDFISALNDPAIKVVSMGPRTSEGLLSVGINPDMMPATFTSSGLLDLLTPQVSGRVVEVVRSDHGSRVLIDGLKRAGAEAHEIRVYSIIRPVGEEQDNLVREVIDGKIDIITFTSAQTVRNFFKTAEDLGLLERVRERLNEIIVAVIGEPTAHTVEDFGVKVDIMPERALFKDMVDEICERTKI
ncbi:MAG: uroporphyrinogen-III synthase [Candidatus Syntropharchaeales archaeon]